MDWLYGYVNNNGYIVDSDNNKLLAEDITFINLHEAEKYCENQDYRITIVEYLDLA